MEPSHRLSRPPFFEFPCRGLVTPVRPIVRRDHECLTTHPAPTPNHVAVAPPAFAVADHQVAHIYLNDPDLAGSVRARLEREPGIAAIWGADEKRAQGLDHPRAGDLIALAKERAWFTYYYWLDDRRAPDFAPTVDIHRKPGYDPVELFLNPATPFIRAKIAWRLLQKRLGLRMLMDVVPIDASLVRGSHGIRPASQDEWPLLISPRTELVSGMPLDSTGIYEILRRHVLD